MQRWVSFLNPTYPVLGPSHVHVGFRSSTQATQYSIRLLLRKILGWDYRRETQQIRQMLGFVPQPNLPSIGFWAKTTQYWELATSLLGFVPQPNLPSIGMGFEIYVFDDFKLPILKVESKNSQGLS